MEAAGSVEPNQPACHTGSMDELMELCWHSPMSQKRDMGHLGTPACAPLETHISKYRDVGHPAPGFGG